MATKIRLARFGAKGAPTYRIVAASSKKARNGRFLEVLGHYDPKKGLKGTQLDQERVGYWKQQGAELSPTVKNILKSLQANAPR